MLPRSSASQVVLKAEATAWAATPGDDRGEQRASVTRTSAVAALARGPEHGDAVRGDRDRGDREHVRPGHALRGRARARPSTMAGTSSSDPRTAARPAAGRSARSRPARWRTAARRRRGRRTRRGPRGPEPRRSTGRRTRSPRAGGRARRVTAAIGSGDQGDQLRRRHEGGPEPFAVAGHPAERRDDHAVEDRAQDGRRPVGDVEGDHVDADGRGVDQPAEDHVVGVEQPPVHEVGDRERQPEAQQRPHDLAAPARPVAPPCSATKTSPVATCPRTRDHAKDVAPPPCRASTTGSGWPPGTRPRSPGRSGPGGTRGPAGPRARRRTRSAPGRSTGRGCGPAAPGCPAGSRAGRRSAPSSRASPRLTPIDSVATVGAMSSGSSPSGRSPTHAELGQARRRPGRPRARPRRRRSPPWTAGGPAAP